MLNAVSRIRVTPPGPGRPDRPGQPSTRPDRPPTARTPTGHRDRPFASRDGRNQRGRGRRDGPQAGSVPPGYHPQPPTAACRLATTRNHRPQRAAWLPPATTDHRQPMRPTGVSRG
ncbi:hypothetical protein GCM10010437_013280 [Actinoplanes palleronii]